MGREGEGELSLACPARKTLFLGVKSPAQSEGERFRKGVFWLDPPVQDPLHGGTVLFWGH